MTEPKEYRIEILADFAAVPVDRLDACLADFKAFLIHANQPESQLDAVVPLTDINTGDPLGIDMSYGQIMLGILAAIRAHQ